MAEYEIDPPESLSLSESIVRPPLSNPIAENSLLVALFESDDQWDQYGMLVEPEWFLDPTHRIVFEEMQNTAKLGERFTPFTIAARIRDRFTDGEHPAVKVVIGMHDAVRVGDTRVFFQRVQNDYVRRRLVAVLKESIQSVSDMAAADVDELIEVIHDKLDATSTERLTDEDIVKSSAPALLTPVLEELDYIRVHARPRNYLRTGFKKLDELSWGGFRPGHLNVIAGRPGMGKTSFALNVCDSVIETNGAHVSILFFTLEQRTEEIMLKMLSMESKVPFGKLKATKLTVDEEKEVAAAVNVIRDYMANFIVVNPDGLTISAMVHMVKQIKRIHGRLDLVCVDYIGLMEPDITRRQTVNRALEIAEITRGLKNLANQEEVPILALAQLNRNADARTDKQPRLSDLRDSGSIEQDADMVMMLHRKDTDYNDSSDSRVQLIVNKNRHGPLGTINLDFDKSITYFCESHPDEESQPLPEIEVNG